MTLSIGPDTFARHYAIGAEVRCPCGVDFRVWAPGKQELRLVLCEENGEERAELQMFNEGNGFFSVSADAVAGDLYGFRIDGQATLFPDPASRFQPQGPTGPSQVVDHSLFPWSDGNWKGVAREGQVLYEMHVGTFTAEGTYAAAAEQLAELARLGITVIELMPLAEFPGRFGWGYDGVCPFAPTRLYGKPDDLRRFMNQAHGQGLGVIMDVVYNHLGPVGQTLEAFSKDYFSQEHKTDWGAAINFDGPGSAEVRNYFLTNAAYWIEEYHFDGFRFDATQDIHDTSEEHVLATLARRVRAGGQRPRDVACRRERAAGLQTRSRPGGGRLWPGFTLERRLSSRGTSRLDRPCRGLSQRLPRQPARIHLYGEIRFSLPGPMVSLAEEATGYAESLDAAGCAGQLP